VTTVNTAHGYTDDPAERDAIRSNIIARALIKAEDEARRIYCSIKCGNSTWGTEEYHRPKHRTDPDGCANDGRTCICACHDGQRAWKANPRPAPAARTDLAETTPDDTGEVATDV